jgi:alpha-galactosidase
MRAILFFFFLVLFLAIPSSFLSGQARGVIDLDVPWKFHVGDSVLFKQPGFDDSHWGALRVDLMWEDQGHPGLDGYGWYRTRVTIPSSLVKNALLKDSLGFFLGKIDDIDRVYLNGMLLGHNGVTVAPGTADTPITRAAPDLWMTDRTYVLGVHDPRIHWDSVNVIAVRVLDVGGMGGMWSGGQQIRMKRPSDYLSLDLNASPRFTGSSVMKTFRLKNISTHYHLSGTLEINARGKLDGRRLLHESKRFSLDPESVLEFPLKLSARDQSAVVTYTHLLSPGPDSLVFSEELPYLLTPVLSASPRINSPSRFGARPGHRFFYGIPASGERPMVFKASGLPRGLDLDPLTGVITGKVAERGSFTVTLYARNDYGEAKRPLTIIIGDTIALTPPMGWNSWNAWGLSVDQKKVLAAARAFREKGLQDHGWSYINIDDGWELKGDDPRPKRTPDGSIIVNEKFPNMRALGDSIHALGLKFGIYSSPGPLTCGGYIGSYGYAQKDAESYASWGIDYLKYDWCTYSTIAKDTSTLELMKPYREMRDALAGVKRDIFYSLCQYGMGNVWEWGAAVGGNSWRTTGDITDTWKSVREIGFSQIDDAPFAGPGRWNDPDMLVIGRVGWGPSLHPSRLTPDEQYSHVTLWCLLSAPLLIGCDVTDLDKFTLNLLTNDEVIAIDQDALGKQARPVIRLDSLQVWVKELEDGTRAAGVFNLSGKTASITLGLSQLGFQRQVHARDVWRHRDLGKFDSGIPVTVPSHGVILLKIR